MRHKKEWTTFAGKVSNRQRPVRFRYEKCDFQNETTNNNLSKGQIKLHSKTGKSTYFYSGGRLNLSSDAYGYGKTRFLKSYFLPITCAMVLLLVTGFAINPMVSGDKEKAYAADNIPGEPGYGEDTTNASIELSVGNNNLSNAAAKAGEVNYLSTTVNVKATDVNGYKMYVQAAPGSSATLTNAGVTVDGVGSKVATVDFGNNKWGYALDETGAGVESLVYSSVPENGSVLNPAYTTDAASEEKNFNLVFAAKFAMDAPAGHYGTNVLLSVAADAETVGGFYNIEYMQDMTTSICSQANENDTKQLIDKRDNKKYWVTKLRDGNCWMTQNLDLDIPASGLTAALSDMETDWNSSSKYPPVETKTTTSGWVANNSTWNAIQSYDPGKLICKTGVGCIVPDGNYDSHQEVGNYYSWAAVVAGEAAESMPSGGTATRTICPKNWTVPNSSGYSSLFVSYGAYRDGTVSYGGQDITVDPLYFVRGGYVFSSSSVSNQGSNGYYWTRSSGSGTVGTALYFSSSVVKDSTSNTSTAVPPVVYRYNGYSVRCLAR